MRLTSFCGDVGDEGDSGVEPDKILLVSYGKVRRWLVKLYRFPGSRLGNSSSIIGCSGSGGTLNSKGLFTSVETFKGMYNCKEMGN